MYLRHYAMGKVDLLPIPLPADGQRYLLPTLAGDLLLIRAYLDVGYQRRLEYGVAAYKLSVRMVARVDF